MDFHTIVNLTPHAITIVSPAGETEIPPSGGIARVSIKETLAGFSRDIPLFSTETGAVTGVPAQEDGVLLIVSGLVRTSLPQRGDLASPARMVRDDAGRVIGCEGFSINTPLEKTWRT